MLVCPLLLSPTLTFPTPIHFTLRIVVYKQVVGNKADLATPQLRDRQSKMVALDLPSVEVSATRGAVSDMATLQAFFDDVVSQRHLSQGIRK